MLRNNHLHFDLPRPEAAGGERGDRLDLGLQRRPEISVPLKNMDGRYTADERTLDELEAEGRVAFRYLDGNPNGSLRDIAGITNAAGNIVGLMRTRARRGAADRHRPHRRPRFLHLDHQEAGQRMSLDTVKHAAETPDAAQLLEGALASSEDEYARSARSWAAAPPAPSSPCTP